MGATDTKKIEREYAAATPFFEKYPDFDISVLPSWVRENIDKARVYGSNDKCIILPDGRKYHLDNKLNDLTGKEWTFFIRSVFSTHYPTSGKEGYAHHIRKVHPTPKPPQLMRDIILFFTKENELVFDSFMGVGGSLLGAALCNRKAAGIDLNPQYIEAYKAAAKELNLCIFPTLCGDSLELLADPRKIKQLTGDSPISLLLIDPPYSDMMSKKKTGADISVYGKNSTPFSSAIPCCRLDNFLPSISNICFVASSYKTTSGRYRLTPFWSFFGRAINFPVFVRK